MKKEFSTKKLRRMNQSEIISKFPKVDTIISLDECGWGAAAGTCAVGLVALPINYKLKVKDSKKYSSHSSRKSAAEAVLREALIHKVVDIPANIINSKGLGPSKNKATISLLEEVILQFNIEDILVIIDGGFIPNLPSILNKYNILAIPKADENITSCSAASVIAKVHRDEFMMRLHTNPVYSMYEFDKNKGYMTAEHKAAIKQYGISDQHRLIKPVKEIIKWREEKGK